MRGYFANIEEKVAANNFFRQVLYTSRYSQLVLMTLKPNEEIGMEVHHNNDQFFRFEEGEGKAIIDGNEYILKAGDVVMVPAGAQHNIINTSSSSLFKMYTIYSPAHHRDGVIHQAKQDAKNDNEEFDGKTTE